MTNGPYNSTYIYLANSSLIGETIARYTDQERLTTTRQYDGLNRLTGIAAGTNFSFSYQYNSANQRTALTNLAVLQNGTNADFVETNIGKLFLPQNPEIFSYDADGNLKQDGRWQYTWDDENRLTSMVASYDTGMWFEYDPQGRRIKKTAAVWTNSSWVTNLIAKYVYDGWNLVAELNSTNGVAQSYMWGLDFSGSMQAAGGVGGLLWLADSTTSSNQTSTHFPCYDGNGNVMALLNATNNTVTAQYEYDPFGQLIRSTGPMAKPNPFHFSSKYQDGESDFMYYGFRYYNPSAGRWLSRDPLEEDGGPNLYGFVGNNSPNSIDAYGLCSSGCGALKNTAFLGAINPLPDIHEGLCHWLEGKIRGFLNSPEEIRGWNRFVDGSANDIELSDKEMGSVLGLARNFQAELNKQSQQCKSTPFYWFSQKTTVGDMIGDPWTLAIGGVSIDLTTSCACGTLTWEACIFDKYNFDPEWWSTHRSKSGEWKTRLVWAAQNVGRCGWKEFHHKGCQDGFISK